MSADTFWWICKLKDWYRICFWQAPDNLCVDEWYELYVARYFWWSKTYNSKEEADIALNDIYIVLEEESKDYYYPFINEYWTLYFCFNELSTEDIDRIEREDFDNYMENL